MFRSFFSKTISGDSEDFCLLINPTGSNKHAKLIFFEMASSKNFNSTWEIYMNPKISSNGLSVSVTKLDSYRSGANDVLFFKNPVITTYGLPVRKFTIPVSTKNFSTNAPTIQLEENESILLKRITPITGILTITTTWTWEEIEN